MEGIKIPMQKVNDSYLFYFDRNLKFEFKSHRAAASFRNKVQLYLNAFMVEAMMNFDHINMLFSGMELVVKEYSFKAKSNAYIMTVNEIIRELQINRNSNNHCVKVHSKLLLLYRTLIDYSEQLYQLSKGRREQLNSYKAKAMNNAFSRSYYDLLTFDMLDEENKLNQLKEKRNGNSIMLQGNEAAA